MRKAQFEIMGLAIIVIVVTVAFFLFLNFSLQPQEDLASQFFEEQFAQNTLDALMKTSLDGCKGTVADYLSAQAKGQPLTAEIGIENPSCASGALQQEIVDVLGKTFQDYQGREFRFQVRKIACTARASEDNAKGCEFIIDAPSDGCDPTNPLVTLGKPGRQLISKHPDPVPAEVVLWICAPK